MHDDERFIEGMDLPVVAGSIVMADHDFQIPDGCPAIVPLAGFNTALLNACIEDVRAVFNSMRGIKHEHTDGIVAAYSWRKYGEPRAFPREDMLTDIATKFHNFDAIDAKADE